MSAGHRLGGSVGGYSSGIVWGKKSSVRTFPERTVCRHSIISYHDILTEGFPGRVVVQIIASYVPCNLPRSNLFDVFVFLSISSIECNSTICGSILQSFHGRAFFWIDLEHKREFQVTLLIWCCDIIPGRWLHSWVCRYHSLKRIAYYYYG